MPLANQFDQWHFSMFFTAKVFVTRWHGVCLLRDGTGLEIAVARFDLFQQRTELR